MYKEGYGIALLCIFLIKSSQISIVSHVNILMDNSLFSGKFSSEEHLWASARMVSDYTKKSVQARFGSYPHLLYDAFGV